LLDAERDPSIGAIIVTGAGRAYCAGADMSALSNIAAGHAGARSAEAPDEWLAANVPTTAPHTRGRWRSAHP